MKTLTLDVATRVGYTVINGGSIVDFGTIELATEVELANQRKDGRERTLDIRFTRLCHFIGSILTQGVTRIVFEDVNFSTTTNQTQLWASLRAAIWAMAQGSSVEVYCVHANTLKAFATGNGKATKDEMASALAKADPVNCQTKGAFLLFKGMIADHDAVDAIWLARFTIAVDVGEERFLSPYDRDRIAEEEKRRKRQARKTADKARQQTKKEEERAKRQRLADAIRAAGRCCDVWRKLGPGHRAVCPKCGNSQPLPSVRIAAKPAVSPTTVHA